VTTSPSCVKYNGDKDKNNYIYYYTTFNIFVRQSLRQGGIPFDITLNQPNQETIAAMLEAERIVKDPSVKGYTDLNELFADLKK
jgi:DNA-damage-inducible protein J